MIGQTAIAIALLGFNDLGRSVTPTFLFRNRLNLQLSPHCPKINKKSMWEVKKKIQDFCLRDMESCHLWQRTFPFKALIAIFWDLQPLWPSLLTKPDLLRFRCYSGHVLSIFFYISDITNSSSFNGKSFRKNQR